MEIYIFPFLLTLFAGLCTGIGGLMAQLSKGYNTKFLSVSLGFSAGVMIYVSFIEIIPKALDSLSALYAEETAYMITIASFFGGIAVIGLVDAFVPSTYNPHEIKDPKATSGSMMLEVDIDNANPYHEPQEDPHRSNQLLRLGLFSALAIAIHNFPEGLATFIASIEDTGLGISIAIAIAIHNIPEGVAIAVPVYYATKNRKKAFSYSLLAGLAEPLGAIIGYAVLYTIFTESAFGIIFASVAGIMVYISLDELLPSAEKYGEHHMAMVGLISGMIVMALSLILLL